MANLPDLRKADPPAVLAAMDKLAYELAWDSDRERLVERLSGGDRAKAKRWRRRLVIWGLREDFQQMVANYVKAIQVLDTGPIVRAIHRRAMKGNIPAAKLAMEASGFHNPRVQHDHTGEIAITIKGLPRPNRTPDDDQVLDAEVVED